MKFIITVEHLNANTKCKQVNITPKFIIWKEILNSLVNSHLICLGYILYTTWYIMHILQSVFLTYVSKIIFLCKQNIVFSLWEPHTLFNQFTLVDIDVFSSFSLINQYCVNVTCKQHTTLNFLKVHGITGLRISMFRTLVSIT